MPHFDGVTKTSKRGGMGGCKYTVLCKSLEPPVISFYFASKEPDFVVIFYSGLDQKFSRLFQGLSGFFFEHWLLFTPFQFSPVC